MRIIYSDIIFELFRHFSYQPYSIHIDHLSNTEIHELNYIEEDAKILFIGKTGYGKSSTLNSLIGKECFKTSNVESCTRVCEGARYQFPNQQGSLTLIDLPGVGESKQLDTEYTSLYESLLSEATVIVYLLRADQRDFAIDEQVFGSLFSANEIRKKLIIGVNGVDKIEPLNRRHPFVPTYEQHLNLDKKINEISSFFSIEREAIIAYSALESWKTRDLLSLITQKVVALLSPKYNPEKRFEKRAKSGDRTAQYSLGLLYYFGDGVIQDYKNAFYWFECAAQKGHMEAQNYLGDMFANGQGISKDIYHAIYWYKNSANQGNPISQFNLGLIYMEGKQVSQNNLEAFQWFLKAAIQGEVAAQHNIGYFYQYGTCGKDIDYDQSINWYKKAAKENYSSSQNNLGYIYENEKKDYLQAFYWYKKAADQDHKNAQFNLGRLFEEGKGVLQSTFAAKTWYKKAARLGNKLAKEKLKEYQD
ncbi:hypothetical protein CJ195_11175 [Bacillus sp. UMB0899]|nr:hypothetical protein CJ195_11175 [Bacillus sp. UMB0899]